MDAENRRRAVIMGVSAAGKSSVAAEIAQLTGIPSADADDLHPAANVTKMAAGTPLTDEDRWPWLDLVGQALAASDADRGLIMACSALRRSYRDRIRARAPDAVFIHLTGSHDLLAARAAARVEHFMPSTLLASQLAILEPLEDDERGISLDVAGTVAQIGREAADWIEGS